MKPAEVSNEEYAKAMEGSYAYPTLKLMGYSNVKILREWSFG